MPCWGSACLAAVVCSGAATLGPALRLASATAVTAATATPARMAAVRRRFTNVWAGQLEAESGGATSAGPEAIPRLPWYRRRGARDPAPESGLPQGACAIFKGDATARAASPAAPALVLGNRTAGGPERRTQMGSGRRQREA